MSDYLPSRRQRGTKLLMKIFVVTRSDPWKAWS